jgi:3-oxoacid CoA-transferase B subunit
MGGAMDLTVGAKKVFAATQHLDGAGGSKLLRRCALPLTAAREVDYVVTDVGFFEVLNGAFVLREYFRPYTVDFILEKTDADVVVDKDCLEVDLG